MRALAPPRAALLAGLLLGSAVVAACSGGDGITGPDRHDAELAFIVMAPGDNAIATVSVEVTGPGIDSTLVFNLTLVNGTATGTARVPAGTGRRIVARAFDLAAVNTHRGDTTVTLVEGTNPAVSLKMLPLVGGVPLTLTFGSTVVSVNRRDTTMTLGDTLRFTAAAVNVRGGTVPVDSIRWGSSNPAVASVSATGLVRALAAGTASIVASYEGAAAKRVVTVPPLAQGVSIVADRYSCLLAVGGAAYCWGLNDAGQLGDGTTGNRTRPVAVLGGLVFQAISAGTIHTCGLTSGGAAYCWGGNNFGQLGDGSTTTRTSPVSISGGLTFKAIITGSYHTCGLTVAGAAYCWGDNRNGELGIGSSSGLGDYRASPVAVVGALVLQSLSAAGEYHTCGLTPGGAAYCWGNNQYGELGDGTTSQRTSPVAVSGGLVFQSINAGKYHTCGFTAAGVGYCWGVNANGQIGDGSTTNRYTPVAVAGGLVFSSLEGGFEHTCGLTVGGSAYCWGDNQYGDLGDGTNTQRTSPVAVSGALVFQAISAGFFHTCGLTTGGASYCWGWNAYGELGDGTTTDRIAPTRVVNP
jgi:alpha-tubulin suppressor-like RCC1 family protein